MANQVPVLPMGISGSYAAMPRGRSWPVPGRQPVHVRIGAPITPGPEESVRSFAPKVQAAVGGNVQAMHLITGPGARHQLAHLPSVSTGVFATVSMVGGAQGGELDPARGWRAVRLDPHGPVEEAWRVAR